MLCRFFFFFRCNRDEATNKHWTHHWAWWWRWFSVAMKQLTMMMERCGQGLKEEQNQSVELESTRLPRDECSSMPMIWWWASGGWRSRQRGDETLRQHGGWVRFHGGGAATTSHTDAQKHTPDKQLNHTRHLYVNKELLCVCHTKWATRLAGNMKPPPASPQLMCVFVYL